MITKTRFVQIGDSKGIRVSKLLLDQPELLDGVEIQAEHGRLIVRAPRRPRAGWAEAAKAMNARGDDQLLDAATFNRFDQKKW